MVARPGGQDVLGSLGLLAGGTITVHVGGYPLASVRADEKELDLEMKGVREAGVSVSKFLKLEEGNRNTLLAAEGIAKELAEMGWRLTLHDGHDRLLTMGRGVSRLTGRIAANPLRAKKLLDVLR